MPDHRRAKRLKRFGADFHRAWNVQFDMCHKNPDKPLKLLREIFHNQAGLASVCFCRLAAGGLAIVLSDLCPGKNREIFGILQSHNKLSARHLHNSQIFAVDNCQAAALRLLQRLKAEIGPETGRSRIRTQIPSGRS
jgi:hypothetical protein